MKRSNLNYYFILSVICIVVIKCLEFPSLTLHAQLFAESATNFFFTAFDKNLLQNFLTPDAGYISLLERVIAVVLVQGLHLTTSYAQVAQMIAVFFVAIFSSVITLRVFRNIFPSDALRFLLALSIGLIPDYELLTYINFVYYGFVPVLLLLFVNKEKIKTKYLLLLFCALLLLIISKPHFLLFLPIFVFVSYSAFRKRLYKTAWFYAGGISAFVLQIFSVLLHPLAFHPTNSGRPLFKKIAEIIYSISVMYKHAFLNDHLFANIPGFLIFIILLAVILGVFVKRQLKTTDQFSLYFFLICNYFAIFSIILTIMTIAAIFPPSMLFFALPNDRHFFFTNIAVLFAGTMVLQVFIKKEWKLLLTVFLLVFTSSTFFYPFDKDQQKKIAFTTFDNYKVQQMSYEQWQYLSVTLQNPDYCIPINPFPWLLHKNCDYLNHYQEIQKTQQSVELFNLWSKYPESTSWKLRSMVLVNIPHHNSFRKLTILAYDRENNLLGGAIQLTPDSTYNYVYFYFPKKITSVTRLSFLENNIPKAIIPEFMFFGTK